MKQVTIIGLGLIGGSWAMALKRVRPDIKICGVDIYPETIQLGLEKKCIDYGTLDFKTGVKDADLIIIATLTTSIISICKGIKDYLKPGCILTDVGSTKAAITEGLYNLLPSHVKYIPGHPMAGSEAKGLKGADPYLFENAVYILTPREQADPFAIAALKELISAIGGRVLFLSPEEHDLKVAAISHLPHLIASSLVYGVSYMEEIYGEIFKLSAGGFRDLTRIASSQPEMWCDIFLENQQALLTALEHFRRGVTQLEEGIKAKDSAKILKILRKSRDEREKVPSKIKGILPNLYEIIVTVPDQPGIIGNLANLLGSENINIIDIEILRVREGNGGTIRFGFSSQLCRDKAIKLFQNRGFPTEVKE